MTFANPLPWWVLVAMVCAAAAIAWQTYRHMAAGAPRRTALTLLRFVTLLAIVLFLMRPVAQAIDAAGREAVVPILVDTSRSMAIQDPGQARRIDRARQLLTERLVPQLGQEFRVEIARLRRPPSSRGRRTQLTATARRSDLQAALGRTARALSRSGGRRRRAAVRWRRHQRRRRAGRRRGRRRGVSDWHRRGAAAGRPRSAQRHRRRGGAGRLAARPRGHGLVARGRHRRRSSCACSRTGARSRSRASRRPPRTRRCAMCSVRRRRAARRPSTPSISPAAAGDPVPENNARSVLVQGPSRAAAHPAGRRRARVRAQLPQARAERETRASRSTRRPQGQGRTAARAPSTSRRRARAVAALVDGYPQTADALSAYDAIVLANVDAALLPGAQLEATRAFVSQRGGGLLVLGAHVVRAARARRHRTGGRPAAAIERARRRRRCRRRSGAGVNRVTLTAEGAVHPVMQIADDAEGSRTRWAAVPPLATVALVGGPRPGASVLAVAESAGGTAARAGRGAALRPRPHDDRSPAKPRGAGACSCRRAIAPTRRSGGRRCDGCRCRPAIRSS